MKTSERKMACRILQSVTRKAARKLMTAARDIGNDEKVGPYNTRHGMAKACVSTLAEALQTAVAAYDSAAAGIEKADRLYACERRKDEK